MFYKLSNIFLSQMEKVGARRGKLIPLNNNCFAPQHDGAERKKTKHNITKLNVQ